MAVLENKNHSKRQKTALLFTRVDHGVAAQVKAKITQDVLVQLGTGTVELNGCKVLYVLCNTVNSWSTVHHHS